MNKKLQARHCLLCERKFAPPRLEKGLCADCRARPVTVDIKRGDHVKICPQCQGVGKIRKPQGFHPGVVKQCNECGGSGLAVDSEKTLSEEARRHASNLAAHTSNFDKIVGLMARTDDAELKKGLARGLLRISFSQTLRALEALISTENFQIKDGLGIDLALANDLTLLLNEPHLDSMEWAKALILLLGRLQKLGLELDLSWLDLPSYGDSEEVSGG